MKKIKIVFVALFTILAVLAAIVYKLRGKGIIDKYFVKFYDKFLKGVYKVNNFYEVEETE